MKITRNLEFIWQAVIWRAIISDNKYVIWNKGTMSF